MFCCNDYVAMQCCQGSKDLQVETIDTYNERRPSIATFAQTLKACGGPVTAPSATANKPFLDLLDANFPELRIYRTGKIQTSPGVEEIADSPTEYYRTVGAMIALLAAYLTVKGDEAGLQLPTAGERGPMSMDKVPGKFINMGNKQEEYKLFCMKFAEHMKTEEDWWAMFVFLAVHDVGKSDEFRNRVNMTLPREKRSDDHDRALANCLRDPDLCAELLPSVKRLGVERQQRIADGFDTNFQLPQLGQGEISVCSLRGLLKLPKARVSDGTLALYLYHSIFDIAGASSNENFIFPLALQPVYVGFSTAMEDLMQRLLETTKPDERSLYFDFLYNNFKKAYPEFEESTFRALCDSRVFRDETGIALLRVLALTRNTYKNVGFLLSTLLTSYQFLVNELAGNVKGPQIMFYYGPDMLRMGLGTDLEDESGDNMQQALGALEGLYHQAREVLAPVAGGEYQFELNVQPVVSVIKAAGKDWKNGAQLREACRGATISNNEFLTEGLLRLKSA